MRDKLTPFDDPDEVAFPETHEIEAHALAFAEMMFEHAEFEREVRELQDAITGQHGFGERPSNKWNARSRPQRMVKLLKQYGGSLPQRGPIKKLLTDAIEPTDQRNLLAHGTWWCFNRRTSTICVRGTTRWESEELSPEQGDYSVTDIRALGATFADLAGKLYPLRREIEQRWTDEERQVGDGRKQWRPGASLVAALGVALLVASLGIGYFLR